MSWRKRYLSKGVFSKIPFPNWNLTYPVLSKNLLIKYEQHPVRLLVWRLFIDIKSKCANLGSEMAQVSVTFSDRYALHKLIKLRKRRFFTSNDRLRLRYIALNVVFLLFAIVHIWPRISDIGVTGDFGRLQLSFLNKNMQAEEEDYDVSYDASSPRLLTMVDEEEPVSLSDLQTTQAIEEDLVKALDRDVPAILEQDRLVFENATPDVLEESTISEAQSEDMIQAAKAMQKKPDPIKKIVKIGTGDVLSLVLEDSGVSRSDAYYAVNAMSQYYKPRQIRPGQEVEITFIPGMVDTPSKGFQKFAIKITPVKEVVVSRSVGGNFSAAISETELEKRTYAVNAEIETSLYGSALRANIPQSVVSEIIRLYSWSVDFQRDLRPGDKIEVYYETLENEDGSYQEFGDIIYANLGVGGRDKPIYRYKTARGDVDYFEPKGNSIRKTLMRTPIDGARLSSGFGMRRHPVLGYNKMHKGTDFAAPTGTPIYAAGDGTVEFIGRNGGYGNYLRIRHNGQLKTAYAHLHRYKKGLTKGARVKQGEVVAYVGTTGRSTGPHLHYEVLVNGVQKNPRSIDLPTGEQLKGSELAQFQNYMTKIDGLYAGTESTDPAKLAQSQY